MTAFAIAVPVVLLMIFFVWWVPRRQVRNQELKELSPEARAKLEDEFRKTLTQAFGSMLVIGSLALAFFQLNDARNVQVEQAQTDLLARGIDLIAADDATKGVAGWFVLQDWAASGASGTDEIDRRFRILVPVLEGALKERRPPVINEEDCNLFHPQKSLQLTTDIWAATTVLRGRARKKRTAVDLKGINLSRVDFSEADLSGSDFSFADLSEANFANARLGDVNFYCANLYMADFAGARLARDPDAGIDAPASLIGANLYKAIFDNERGGTADLRGVDLQVTILSDAVLGNANLGGADLTGANLFGATVGPSIGVDPTTDLTKACLVELQGQGSATLADKAHDSDKARTSNPGECALDHQSMGADPQFKRCGYIPELPRRDRRMAVR